MGVAGHEHLLVALALSLEGVKEACYTLHNLLDFAPDKEAQIHKHLVVARPPGVDFLADVAKAACEHQFHLRVDIFHSILNHKPPSNCVGIDVAQCRKQRVEFILGKKPYRLEHRDVCH